MKLEERINQLAIAYQDLNVRELEKIQNELLIMQRIHQLLPPTRPRTLTIPAIFGRSYDELFIAQYLAYVLDSKLNGVGIEPLRLLLTELGGTDVEFEVVELHREYTFQNGRRIDLLLLIDKVIVLGIEVKIFAQESDQQTSDYARSIRNQFPNHQHYFVFLSPDGRKARSQDFYPLSFLRLWELLKEIRYEWISDLRRAVIWEDFLTHLEEYIMKQEARLELSEKTKLYLEHYEMIVDLKKSYEADLEQIFGYIISPIKAYYDPEIWQVDFSSSNNWQAISKYPWKQNDLYIHFEYWFGKNILMQNDFYFMLEAEGSLAESFLQMFDAYEETLKIDYAKKGISYRPGNRKQAIAFKKFPLTNNKNIEEISPQLIAAVDEFSFLIPYIDETLDKLRQKQEDPIIKVTLTNPVLTEEKMS